MTAPEVASLLRRPVIVAPMAGGPSTPGLVVAASRAGAFGFLAGGYKTSEVLAAEIAQVRAATGEPFGVNVFVPGLPTADPEAVTAYLASLDSDAAALGTRPGEPRWSDDGWQSKLDTLIADPVPLVSFTFGCPPREIVDALHRAGSLVAVTVTTDSEAATAAAAGADALCVQGAEAGGHRGGFDNPSLHTDGTPLLELIARVAAATDLPQFAAGGVANAEQVAAVLHAGATAVQCGTAFLRSVESGTHPAHQAALADPRYTHTTVTRAFSGRPARGLINDFVRAHPDASAAYPEVNAATRPLRAAATAAGDTERMSLWAGTGYRQARALPAAQIVALLDPGSPPHRPPLS